MSDIPTNNTNKMDPLLSRGLRRPAANAAVLVSLLIMSACSLDLRRPEPVKNYYLLEPSAQPAQGAPLYNFALRVANIEVAPPFQERGLVYRLDEQRFDADFYHQFFVAPRSMVTTQTAQWLGQRHIFAAVLTPASTLDSPYTLEGLVNQIYADVRRGQQPSSVFTMQTFLLRTLDRTIVLDRSYSHTVYIPNQSASSVVSGLSQAFEQCLADLEHDLRGLNLKP